MAASHYNLDNLIMILDYNKLQITGANNDVMNSEPIAEKFRSFGWAVKEVDGHNIAELKDTFHQMPIVKGKPSLVIAHTIKGKGVSFMENAVNWHHKVPDKEQYALAQKELDEKILALSTTETKEL